MSPLSAWSVFFNTAAESAATLAGLVMVALSVNVQRIIAHNHLPARASGAVSALVMVLVLSLAALIPQPLSDYALELDAAAALAWLLHILTARHVIRGHVENGRPRGETVIAMILGQAQVLPLTIGAILLTLGHDIGLYWTAGSIVAVLMVSVINAWVLLVEILR